MLALTARVRSMELVTVSGTLPTLLAPFPSVSDSVRLDVVLVIVVPSVPTLGLATISSVFVALLAIVPIVHSPLPLL